MSCLEIVIPTDYYFEDIYPDHMGEQIGDDLTMVKIRDIDDVFLNYMKMEEIVEILGIDSEFVVSTNWDEVGGT